MRLAVVPARVQERRERPPGPGSGSAQSAPGLLGGTALLRQESLERPPWFGFALDRLDVTHEALDQLARLRLRLDVGPLLDPELVAPYRHRARSMRDHDRSPVDHVAHVAAGEYAAVALGEARQVGHEHVERRCDGPVAAPFGAMARRAELIEQ